MELVTSAAKDRYRHKEVVDRLRTDFCGKCYICEIGIPSCCWSGEPVENGICVGVLDEGDQEAQLTARLTEEVFMTDNPPMTEIRASVRLKELQAQMGLLYSSLHDHLGTLPFRCALYHRLRVAPGGVASQVVCWNVRFGKSKAYT